MNLIERAKNIVLQPKSEWLVIEGESTPVADLYKEYIVPLAAITPLAGIIGMSMVGVMGYRVPLASGIAYALTSYVLTLVGVFILALIIDALAPSFGGKKNQMQALKVAAYASTPGWLAGVLLILPMLGIITPLAELYGLYLLYLGLPVLMKAPQEKAVGYTVVVVVAAIVVMVVISGISSSFIAAPIMPMPEFVPPVR